MREKKRDGVIERLRERDARTAKERQSKSKKESSHLQIERKRDIDAKTAKERQRCKDSERNTKNERGRVNICLLAHRKKAHGR